MDKAAKAVRRGGVRILSFGGGHSDLNVVISEMKDVRNSAKGFMAAQNSAAQYLMKWASREDNRALQDVSTHFMELNMVWTEVQREFTEHLKEFKQMFDFVAEGERHVDQAKANLLACEQREYKIKKELKKAAKRKSPDEVSFLEMKLAQAERQKDLSQIEVADRVRENETMKQIRFKEGLLQVSEAYVEMGHKCAILFEAQRDIACQLPDALGTDLEDVKYTGSGQAKQYVNMAKGKIRQYSRHSQLQCQAHNAELEPDEPPPPYTPGDYFALPQDAHRHIPHQPEPELPEQHYPPQILSAPRYVISPLEESMNFTGNSDVTARDTDGLYPERSHAQSRDNGDTSSWQLHADGVIAAVPARGTLSGDLSDNPSLLPAPSQPQATHRAGVGDGGGEEPDWNSDRCGDDGITGAMGGMKL